MRHLGTNNVCEILGHGPGNGGFAHHQRSHDVQALAAGRLAERFKACRLEPVADLERADDDRIETHIRRGI